MGDAWMAVWAPAAARAANAAVPEVQTDAFDVDT
jgi:hypothetical protein